ncbi:MAG: hypothetical protein WAW41_01090 [Methylobacter sp.]
MKKPYFVEIKIKIVVMAESLVDAIMFGEENINNILADGVSVDGAARDLLSLDQLYDLDPEWDGGSIPYNNDDTMLKDLLPEK